MRGRRGKFLIGRWCFLRGRVLPMTPNYSMSSAPGQACAAVRPLFRMAYSSTGGSERHKNVNLPHKKAALPLSNDQVCMCWCECIYIYIYIPFAEIVPGWRDWMVSTTVLAVRPKQDYKSANEATEKQKGNSTEWGDTWLYYVCSTWE